MNVIHTQYEFGIKLQKQYQDIYNTARRNSTFMANLPDMADILNILYADIWNDKYTNNTYKYL